MIGRLSVANEKRNVWLASERFDEMKTCKRASKSHRERTDSISEGSDEEMKQEFACEF